MTDAITYLEEQHRLRRNVLTGELLYADADHDELVALFPHLFRDLPHAPQGNHSV